MEGKGTGASARPYSADCSVIWLTKVAKPLGKTGREWLMCHRSQRRTTSKSKAKQKQSTEALSLFSERRETFVQL